ncbi:hypothetical protein [Lysobacter panacisoli]|uniref:DUF1376 domain-containing protein n=1 Tax=Lysobacter panacisoli TaxID=1255263 RepID=A0ABP9LGM5_9GAMM|nr:hypothetical protein [Lysobacter panacisoli]
MKTDIRINTELFAHPKYKRLLRRLSWCGCAHLPHLFAWAAANRPDGDLSGLTDEDLELAVNYPPGQGAFIAILAEIGFLEGEEGARQIHDWAEHQPWASGSSLRAARGKWNSIKRHHGEAEADRQVPEWAARRNADSSKIDAASNANSNADSLLPAMLGNGCSNAPYPSPSPSPSPSPKARAIAQQAARSGRSRVAYTETFERFWAAYPNRKGKAVAFKAWVKLQLDSEVEALITDVTARHARDRDWLRDGGAYIPHGSTYLAQRRWEDEITSDGPGSRSVEAWEIAE